jgi:hypothetical protein
MTRQLGVTVDTGGAAEAEIIAAALECPVEAIAVVDAQAGEDLLD